MEQYEVSGELSNNFGTWLGSYKTTTWAVSESKARSNALYQAKKKMNLIARARVKWSSVKVVKIS